MATRITHETIYIRHPFTDAERLQMGSELAEAHTHLETIEDEEKQVKAQFNERKAGANTRIGSLSRMLSSGFEMRNVKCELKWDTPNVGEVSYIGPDGMVEKVRAMAPSEHQMELELAGGEEKTLDPEAEVAAVTESEKAVEAFFDKPSEEAETPQVDEDDKVEDTEETVGDENF